MNRSEIKALSAIKKYCKECSGGSELEASRCTLKGCPLYEFKPTLSERSKVIATKQTKKGA